ncbi:MAG: alpha/beta hydrolase family protein [Bradymonadia bacterium]
MRSSLLRGLPLIALTLCSTVGCDRDAGGGTAQAAPPAVTTGATILAAPAGRNVKIPQPTKLTAVHQHGQTFISWDEVGGKKGRYQIYRLHQPITAANINTATLLAEVGQGSARWYANRSIKDTGEWYWRYGEQLVNPDGTRVPKGRGLLVWTIGKADPTPSYYAVVSANSKGANRTEFGPGNSVGPIEESIADPRPIEVADADIGPQGHLMVQYMDLRNYNGTFHAPGPHNKFLGLPEGDPGRAHQLAYAHDYGVYEPEPGKCQPGQKIAVILKPHGWGGGRYKPATRNPDPWWCAFMIFPIDQGQTWHFGFGRKTDYRKGKPPAAGDEIVNYTEAREVRMVHDLLNDPKFSSMVDRERVYAFGHSMGGSGALALAMRYPDLFAATYAASPMANYRTSGSGGGANWVNDVTPKWGSPDLNLPVVLQFPGGYGAHLKQYEGTGVWDWQNHVQQLRSRTADPMAPLGVLHGTADRQVNWSTQAVELFPALDAGKRTWSAAATTAGHNWQGFRGLGGPLRAPQGAPFDQLRVVKSETIPGISNVSSNPALNPPVAGLYNHQIYWSSSWLSWDGKPIDQAERWRISLCTSAPNEARCGSGAPATVDITPRRTQKFKITPKGNYIWKLKLKRNNALIGSGQITADEHGVLTVPQVKIDPQGVRLEINPFNPGK